MGWPLRGRSDIMTQEYKLNTDDEGKRLLSVEDVEAEFAVTVEEKFALLERSLVLDAAILVRQIRTEAELTQGQLATRLDATQSWISQLENPNRKSGPPELGTLARIAAACGRQIRVTIV